MSSLSSASGAPHAPERVIQLAAPAPFNLVATVRLLQRRPTNRIDHWQEGRYQRAFHTGDGMRLLVVENVGTSEEPEVRGAIMGGPITDTVASDLNDTMSWMLGLDAEPAPTGWIAEKEPRLASIAAAVQGFRPPCFPTLFETCARVVPFQQLSIDAGTAIIGRLVERFGPSLTVDGRQWIAFPSPEAIADARPEWLREAGLSRAKTASLQGLARLALEGELTTARFRALPTDDALIELRTLPGIGPWSAGLILLRGLRRMDVFPPGDVGAAHNLTALLGLPEPLAPSEAKTYAACFGERQGYLYFLALANQLRARGVSLTAD